MINHEPAVEHEGRIIERLERHHFYAAVVVDKQAAAGEVPVAIALRPAPQLNAVHAIVVLDVPADQGVALEDADAVFSRAQTVEYAFVHLKRGEMRYIEEGLDGEKNYEY